MGYNLQPNELIRLFVNPDKSYSSHVKLRDGKLRNANGKGTTIVHRNGRKQKAHF